jgi:hypothetical protein
MHLIQRTGLGNLLNQTALLGVGAEVGVAEGTFSSQILESWKGRQLFLIDCWEQQQTDYRDAANQNPEEHARRRAKVASLCQRDPRAQMLPGFSPDAARNFADESLDFVYLDANHSYLAVRADLEAWYPKVKVGGLFAGHDYLDGYVGFATDVQGGTLFGVKTAVDELARSLGQAAAFTLGDEPYRSWFFFKRAPATPPSILMVTGYDDPYANIGDISMPGKEAYCRRHGYTLRCHRDGFDKTRPSPWSKIRFLWDDIYDADWVFWTDADSLVMNPSIPLTRFVYDAVDLIFPIDRINGINTGNFFVRRSQWAHDFLKWVYGQEQFVNHRWWENAAVIAVYNNPQVQERVLLLPNKLFNAYPYDGTYSTDDFIIHFPGLSSREVFMRNYAAMAQAQRADCGAHGNGSEERPRN